MVAVGGLYYVEHGKVATAEANLEETQAETVRLQREINKLAYVTETQQALAAAQATVQLTLGNEVRWSQYLHDISLVIPDDVWLTQVNVTQNTDGAAPPPAAPRRRCPATAACPTPWGR